MGFEEMGSLTPGGGGVGGSINGSAMPEGSEGRRKDGRYRDSFHNEMETFLTF